MTTETFAVTETAMIQRLRRALRKEGTRLVHMPKDAGRYYAVNDRNVVIAQHVDPEAWARDAGVLKPDERVLYCPDGVQ